MRFLGWIIGALLGSIGGGRGALLARHRLVAIAKIACNERRAAGRT